MTMYVMCGLPRSGKSTTVNDLSYSTTVISGDSIRLALTGQRFNNNIEDYVSAIKHTIIKAQLLSGKDIIVDGTHTTIASVKKLERTIEELESLTGEKEQIAFIFVSTPKEACIERAIKSNQADLIPVIEKMATQLEETTVYIKTKYTKKLSLHGQNSVYEVFTV